MSRIPKDKFDSRSFAKGIRQGLIAGRNEGRREAANMADWLEGALMCASWDWSPDQEDYAWQALNDWRVSVGKEPLTPTKNLV